MQLYVYVSKRTQKHCMSLDFSAFATIIFLTFVKFRDNILMTINRCKGAVFMSNFLTKKDMDSLSLDALDTERKNQIMAIKQSIVFNSEETSNFANDASKNLTQFSSELLREVKLKDAPEVEGLINELMVGLEKVDASTLQESKPTFIKKLFKIDEVKQFITRYEDVEGIIQTVKEKLEMANFQLKKDIVLCERHRNQNLAYINDLDNYIVAGRMRLQEEQADIDACRAVVDKTDQLAVYALDDRQNEVDRFERKLYNLLLMREIAVQNLPQLSLIKNGDSVLSEKIQASIDTVIPLWESQMVIAIQLLRQKGALALEQSVRNTTNNLIAKNGELLMNGGIEVAKSLEAGVVDVAVLEKNTENLIKTMAAIKDIQANGKKERLEATQKLAQLQSKLNEQLLLAN